GIVETAAANLLRSARVSRPCSKQRPTDGGGHEATRLLREGGHRIGCAGIVAGVQIFIERREQLRRRTAQRPRAGTRARWPSRRHGRTAFECERELRTMERRPGVRSIPEQFG